ncbi:MAG: hypothetical protein KDD35_03870 [Bdellovibrionales bacterium]|nr:hypothetical protein [Bdellovibrionales bacterium]
MRNVFRIIVLLGIFSGTSTRIQAMDFSAEATTKEGKLSLQLGQLVKVTDSEAFGAIPIVPKGTTLKLNSIELFGDDQGVLLGFDLYFTRNGGKKSGFKNSRHEDNSFRVFLDPQIESIDQIPGITPIRK